LHLLVDSTGLKLFGAGEWLIEKHGTKNAPVLEENCTSAWMQTLDRLSLGTDQP
jgi:hypothetical protein